MKNSSFVKVSEQIINYNKNIIEVLSKINSVYTSNNPNITMNLIDSDGVETSIDIASFNFYKTEIERLSNSLESIYNLNGNGTLVKSGDTYKKVVALDLNHEPIAISNVSSVDKFNISKNWFFDSLVNPKLQVEFDLSDKIADNVTKVLSRRYIISFATNSDGSLTSLGESAKKSFIDNFLNKNDIEITELERWHKTTAGVVDALNPNIDEEIFDLQPNELLYDGIFNVISIEEDDLNRKLWYVLNTLDYKLTNTNDIRQLGIGNELIVNHKESNTRYRIIEVSTTESLPRIRVEMIEGFQPIPIGVGVLKVYSPVIYNKKLRVSIGYDEYNVVFMKPINNLNLMSRHWSKGTSFYTNNLRLSSNDTDNGKSMEQFYSESVYDYGQVLHDLVAKKIPNKLAGIPNAPIMDENNFKVVQINKHLTDSVDSNLIKNKHNQAISLKNEITQIQEAIEDRSSKIKLIKSSSKSEKKKFENELVELNNRKTAKSKLLTSLNQEILDLSRNNSTKVEPKFRLRGFWAMPEPIVSKGTLPQEVIQFIIEYRYTSKDGREPSVETFNITDNNQQKVGAYVWTRIKTDVRKRIYDKDTDTYTWEIDNVEDINTPTINQIDIPISYNERIEIRVKSISEVGYPESPVESEWSNIIVKDFPDDMNNILNDNGYIINEATKEDVKSTVISELSSRGIDRHLNDGILINSDEYFHSTENILSGMVDENGYHLSLYKYLQSLEKRIVSLEEKLMRVKGELVIKIFRNNDEFEIRNNSETIFNVECEDYLTPYDKSDIIGRVYANNVYIIKDFVLKISNKSLESPLGLLSGRNYKDRSVYNTSAPQCFWVNNQDELIFNDVSGVTETQVNNQFLWLINYESIKSENNVVSRLSDNIGNLFLENNSNSLTNILSLSEFNIGYDENMSLSFVNTNNSLLDSSKWVDDVVSVSSTHKFLSSVHPVINNIEDIVENNIDRVKTLNGGEEIVIPINIYFKMNALDNTKSGINYEYINLNNETKTSKHLKKLKFMVENESENKPFIFTLVFNLNRNMVNFSSRPKNYNKNIK